MGNAAARSACILGVAADRRARLRAPYRQPRSEDGGATGRHPAGMEACQALEALLTAALALPPEHGLRRWTYHTLFGLIAATGMRLSEVMGLERDDVDLDTGVLTIRPTKFGKSRLVPLHPTPTAPPRRHAKPREAPLRPPRG